MKRQATFILLIALLSYNYTISEDFSEKYFLDKYSEISHKIIQTARQDDDPYFKLGYWCDMFGPRLSGSESLEKSIDWLLEEMKKDGFQNVRKEPVMVPHWVRRAESCNMIYPREGLIPISALGGSIATPKDGITGEVIVVHSFDELDNRKDEVKGKIVVYNTPYEGYGKTVQYRFYGAINAAKYGAIASLIRTVSPNVNRLINTGMMGYDDTIPKIPHAAITAEDVMMLERLISYGKTPKINIKLDVETLGDAQSYNVVGELVGSELPNEIITLGGHTDSWDYGTGAQDDASGCIVTWKAIKLLKDLGLKPKRTIRVVLFTNEENGVKGGYAYRDAHQNEKHILMFEHDLGVFKPKSIGISGNDEILSIFKNTQKLFSEIVDLPIKIGGGGADISPMTRLGVPAMGLDTDDEGKYFYYHHAASDTFDKVKKEDVNDCIASIALAIYLYSDLPNDMFNK